MNLVFKTRNIFVLLGILVIGRAGPWHRRQNTLQNDRRTPHERQAGVLKRKKEKNTLSWYCNFILAKLLQNSVRRFLFKGLAALSNEANMSVDLLDRINSPLKTAKSSAVSLCIAPTNAKTVKLAFPFLGALPHNITNHMEHSSRTTWILHCISEIILGGL